MPSPVSSTICGTPGAKRNVGRCMVACTCISGKWCAAADKSIFGAAERFYLELTEDNRRLLVERAVLMYDGRRSRNRNINIEEQSL